MNRNYKPTTMNQPLILLVLFCSLCLTGGFRSGNSLLNAATEEKPYRWPLDINNGFSSAFQEFRSNHFHGGFDMRTNQRTGYPVYAVSDGEIFKIRMARLGTGRGLYLKHDDGNTSIYFHLDRFEKKLEDLLIRVQKLNRKKYIDNYFLKKPIRYKKGEQIAYSGETGAGSPHLHLEIRDKHYFALNPAKWITFPSSDKNFPLIKGVLIRSRGGAFVNGDVAETYIPFKQHGESSTDRTLLISGPADLVLKAHDRSDSGRNAAPYGIDMLIDGQSCYKLRFDRFERDDNNQLGFVYDLEHSTSGAYYFNLFPQKGYTLEQAQTPAAIVLDSLAPGKHQFRFQVEDFFGNQSVALLNFFKIIEPVFEVSNLRYLPEEKTIHLTIEQLDSQEGGEIKISVYNGNSNKIASGALDIFRLSQNKPLIFKGVTPGATYLDFDFYYKGVLYHKKQYLLNNANLSAVTDIQYDTVINRDDVTLRITEPKLTQHNIKLTVKQGAESLNVEPRSSNQQIYFTFKPLNNETPLLLTFTLMDDAGKVVEIQKKLHLIYLSEGNPQTYKYEEFEAHFAPRAVYEPHALKLTETNHPSTFPILSRQISLAPYNFPFLDTVYYTFTKTLPNPQQVGIFKYNNNSHRWYACYTQYDAASTTYKTRLISSGTYALMRDTFPPNISFSRPKTKWKNKVWRLNVKIWDKGKGVNDESITLWLNGKKICTTYDCKCDYDPDKSVLIIEELDNLKQGTNYLKVHVKDYAGNKTERTFSFNLQ